jgi:hypothetical protein
MTNEQINELYDNDINMTYSKLSRITGKSHFELRQILMPDAEPINWGNNQKESFQGN